MKEKLSIKDYFFLSSMLFGMFFGAGNLIFPVHVGNQAGKDFVSAIIGFCVSAVLLPLLGVIAMSISKVEGLYKLQEKVGKIFGIFFLTSLYLSVGPLFAIPRAIMVSFTVSLEPFIPYEYKTVATLLFSFIFFNIIVFFSLRPQNFILWIGKLFNPFFMITVTILIVSVFINPTGDAFSPNPIPGYKSYSFLNGALEGYNTLDVLGSLAFSIILIGGINKLGVSNSKSVTKSVIIIGLMTFSTIAISYFILGYIGSSTRHLIGTTKNGGEALQIIAFHYFGNYGSVLLGSAITFACLKTSISIITAASSSFTKVAKGNVSYNFFAILFSFISFILSNLGLSGILTYTLPFIIFLYPIAIIIILFLLLDWIFNFNTITIKLTIYVTSFFALIDSIRVLSINHVSGISLMNSPIRRIFGSSFQLNNYLPFFHIKLSWVFFGGLGILISILVSLFEKKRNTKTKNSTK